MSFSLSVTSDRSLIGSGRRCEILKVPLAANQIKAASFADSGAWARKAILNVADCGKFSSDHKIAQSYAEI
jgi:glucan phosphorylase